MKSISYPSPRVSQLDASILDAELTSLLREKLGTIFQHHQNSSWSIDQNSELWSLLLNLIIFKLTVWKKGTTYGLSLQNLKLTDFKTRTIIGYKKRSLLLFFLIGEFAYKKLSSYLYAIDDFAQFTNKHMSPTQKIKAVIIKNSHTILTKINHTVKILNLINFTLFLVNGKYPSLLHRVLQISLTPIVKDLFRFNGDNVNYEFQNRQLVWSVMTEFLVFILPLLQLKSLRKIARNALWSKGTKSGSQPKQIKKQSPYSVLPKSECAICHSINNIGFVSGINGTKSASSAITNPYITNCGHVYCYVCISTKFNAMDALDENANLCLRCGEKLEWFTEYGLNEIDEDAIMVDYEEIKVEDKIFNTPLNDGVQYECADGESVSDDNNSYSEDQEYEADEF